MYSDTKETYFAVRKVLSTIEIQALETPGFLARLA